MRRFSVDSSPVLPRKKTRQAIEASLTSGGSKNPGQRAVKSKEETNQMIETVSQQPKCRAVKSFPTRDVTKKKIFQESRP